MQKIIGFNKKCGLRLKKIREIFNEGRKLSAEQFAHLLDESRDKIANYEAGRTQIPLSMLYELYKRGINPSFIITGEGDIFTDDANGLKLKRKIELKATLDKETARNYANLVSETIADLRDAEPIRAAAGKIKNESSK